MVITSSTTIATVITRLGVGRESIEAIGMNSLLLPQMVAGLSCSPRDILGHYRVEIGMISMLSQRHCLSAQLGVLLACSGG